MEQRLVRMGVLDRPLLAAMTGAASAGPRGIDASALKAQPLDQPQALPPAPNLALGEIYLNLGKGSHLNLFGAISVQGTFPLSLRHQRGRRPPRNLSPPNIHLE